MIPQFSLSPQHLGQDTVRIDVVVRSLPDHFLGTAFDVKVPEGWYFDHYELCDVFSPEEQNIFHLASPRTDDRGVIFGLAAAGGGYGDPGDGCLVRFYFSLDDPLPGEIFFDHTALSVYKDGRLDVSDVRWIGARYDVPLQITAIGGPVSTQELVDTRVMQGTRAGRADFFGSLDSSLVDVYVLLFITLVLAAAVFLVFLAYFRLRPKD